MTKINKSRYAILGFLTMRSASGYDIKKAMQMTTEHFWREGDSSIYPILKQLLEEGTVTCEVDNPESGKPRKVYTITEDGREQLEEWLCVKPEEFYNRNELLLKLFFGWNIEKDIIIGHLEDSKEKCEKRLVQFKEWEKLTDVKTCDTDQLYRFITLRSGVITNEAKIRWADEAISILQKRK